MTSAHQHPSLGASLFGEDPWRPIVIHSVVAAVGIVLAWAGDVFAAVNSWRVYQLVHDFRAGQATVAQLDESDDLAASWWRLLFAVQVVGFVAFLFWLRRARTNAEWFAGPDSQRRGRGWVIGAWICPVVNLWFPYQVVADIWRASPVRRPVSPALVVLWWLVFMASSVVNFLVLRPQLVNSSVAAEQVLRDTATLSTVSAVLSLVAGVLIILIISRIALWQNTPRDPGDVPVADGA